MARVPSLMPPQIRFRRAIKFIGWFAILGVLALFLSLLTGCPSKSPVAEAPPPPPPPLAPTAVIEANPMTVQAGQAVVITWKTENATEVNIAPLGAVQASGSTTLNPTESTTYHLTAKGPGGVQEADARISVVATAAEESAPAPEAMSVDEASRLDIYFDLDDFSIRTDQMATIQNDAAFLKEHPEVRIVVEGHCDEMGSTEYNLALGDKRAAQVKFALEKAGINASRMRVISYGKEQPFCVESNEACWRQNRRAHITYDMQR